MYRHAALAALALLACAPEESGPAEACPLDAPVRLVAPPAGWKPLAGWRAAFQTFGDHLFYRFPYGHPAPNYWLVHRCGGEPERFPAATGMSSFRAQDTDEGLVVYGQDEAYRHYVLDRLDVPGLDKRAPILGLPDERFYATPSQFGLYLATNRTPQNLLTPTAGIGAAAEAVFLHHGDPAVPAVKLADAAVRLMVFGERLLVHDDDGSLRAVDPYTGDSELVLTGVRRFTVTSDARRIIWQQLGDDLVEPIFLRDVDTGLDVAIAVNNFTAVSWNRLGDDETVSVGSWIFTGDDAYAALYGPWNAPVAVVRVDDGEPVAPPADVRLRGRLRHEFDLVVDDRDEHVRALWDPRTGELREWYRGPLAAPTPGIFAYDDDHIDYLVPDVSGTSSTLWRLDRAGGEATVRVPRLGIGPRVLDDGRYLMVFPSSNFNPLDVVVFDPDTGYYTTIAADVDDYTYFPDQGIIYFDPRGGDNGLWAAPIPEK